MKRVSPSEQTILEILWQRGPLTAQEVVTYGQAETPWSANTIKTFLGRLRDKGAVLVERRGVNLYRAAYSRKEAALTAAAQAAKEGFGGSFATLTAHMIEEGRLSEADLAELRALLRHLEADKP